MEIRNLDYPYHGTSNIKEDIERDMEWQNRRYFPLDLDVSGLRKEILDIFNEDELYDDTVFTDTEWGSYFEGMSSVQWPMRDKSGAYGLRHLDLMTEKGWQIGEIINEWVYDNFKYLPRHTCMNSIKAGTNVKPHKDNNIRSSVVLVHLTKENFYGTTHQQYCEPMPEICKGNYQVPYMDCYVFNTQINHTTVPVPYNRCTVHLAYDEHMDALREIYESGNLVKNRFKQL